MGTAASVLSAPEAAQAEALDARADGLEEYVGWPLGSVEQVLDKYEELGTGAPRIHLAGSPAELQLIGYAPLRAELYVSLLKMLTGPPDDNVASKGWELLIGVVVLIAVNPEKS